jgi:hypothetical protein
MWRWLGTAFVVVVSIVLPLTVKPSAPVLAVGWLLAAMFLVGFLLTWPPVDRRVWTYVAERVAEHQPPAGDDTAASEAEARRRARHEEFAASAHQVLDELATIRMRVSEAKQNGSFAWNFELPGSAWPGNRDVIAAMTPTVTRSAVADVYVRADHLNRRARDEQGDGRAVSSDDDLDEMLRAVHVAEVSLRQALGNGGGRTFAIIG